MAEYQGHVSWNAWNVALYIENESHLYFAGRKAIADANGDISKAFRLFSVRTKIIGTKTPDGAIYNAKSVRAALEGIAD